MPGGALGTWTESVKSQERNELQEPPIKNPLKIKAASQTLGSREVSLETQKKKKKKTGLFVRPQREGNAEWKTSGIPRVQIWRNAAADLHCP